MVLMVLPFSCGSSHAEPSSVNGAGSEDGEWVMVLMVLPFSYGSSPAEPSSVNGAGSEDG